MMIYNDAQLLLWQQISNDSMISAAMLMSRCAACPAEWGVKWDRTGNVSNVIVCTARSRQTQNTQM